MKFSFYNFEFLQIGPSQNLFTLDNVACRTLPQNMMNLPFPFIVYLSLLLHAAHLMAQASALAAMLSQYCSFWGYPLCRLFYAFGLDVCLYSGLKWMKFPVTSLMQIEWEYDCYFNQLASWVLANIMCLPVGNVTETQDPDFGIVFCCNFWADAYRLIYTCCSELVTSVWIMAARH
jgi:hypothetical protein